MTRNEAIAKIIDALDALQLLPPFPADEVNPASHHRVDPNTVSAPHPTTGLARSNYPQEGTQRLSQSWQRITDPPDHPTGTA